MVSFGFWVPVALFVSPVAWWKLSESDAFLRLVGGYVCTFNSGGCHFGSVSFSLCTASSSGVDRGRAFQKC